jgi:single-strand DNA-binding protein
MFDTNVTIVGNVLHGPEWRKTTNTGALVTTFKIASTARRYDRQAGQWMDGNSLRVRVNCWRALAANVKESVAIGDPLVVTGRLFTRDWIDENGMKRLQYEVEATSVGHDLSRGKAVFQRRKVSTATSMTEDTEAQQRIGGEVTESVPDDEAPTQFDDTPFEVALDQMAYQSPDAFDPLLDSGSPAETVEPVGAVAEPDELSPVGEDGDEPEPVDAGDQLAGPDRVEVEQPGEPGPRRRGLRRNKVPA